jgi:hypothetical protein
MKSIFAVDFVKNNKINRENTVEFETNELKDTITMNY